MTSSAVIIPLMIHCRGLAGRLASTEDCLALVSDQGDRLDNRWIMLTRKREKLGAQLNEAIWIKNAIERKTPKVKILAIKFIFCL